MLNSLTAMTLLLAIGDPLPPTDGWTWVLPPERLKDVTHVAVFSREGVKTTSCTVSNGFAIAFVPPEKGTTYQVAAFDEKRSRVELSSAGAGAGNALVQLYSLSDSSAIFVGIEALSYAERAKHAARAFAEARRRGLSPLPFIGDLDDPELVQHGRYPVELRIGNRVVVDQGRPTIIQCWGTWCGPCLQEMTELAHLSKEFEFDVISVSHDSDRGKAESMLKRRGRADWPLFLLPTKQTDRDLWLKSLHGTSDERVPVVIVLDAKGDLADVNPQDLRASLTHLKVAAAQPPRREEPSAEQAPGR